LYSISSRLRRTAASCSITSARCASRVLAQGEDVVPIPGTKRRSYLEQNAAAVDVELTDDDLARIDAELPAAVGARYDSRGMQALNN
jgi:aryl-alcohol dehydrogenase-like predicted oxidoreductase